MSFAASPGRRWLVGSIAVYVADHAVAIQVVEAVERNGDSAARMGVVELDNGDRVAWVRFDDRQSIMFRQSEGGPK